MERDTRPDCSSFPITGTTSMAKRNPIIPAEPTQKMLDAGREASRKVGPLGNWLSDRQILPIWRAMLAAAE
jgi:hypothetical protein